jgi:hypothetical protein
MSGMMWIINDCQCSTSSERGWSTEGGRRQGQNDRHAGAVQIPMLVKQDRVRQPHKHLSTSLDKCFCCKRLHLLRGLFSMTAAAGTSAFSEIVPLPRLQPLRARTKQRGLIIRIRHVYGVMCLASNDCWKFRRQDASFGGFHMRVAAIPWALSASQHVSLGSSSSRLRLKQGNKPRTEYAVASATSPLVLQTIAKHWFVETHRHRSARPASSK